MKPPAMKITQLVLSVSLMLITAAAFAPPVQGQQLTEADGRLVGGPCEGCEAVFEYGDRELTPVDTLPDFNDPGPKLKVTGTIYMPDGETPAQGVILYIWHTNQEGVYPRRGDETGWARRHGYIRGWAKTGKDGTYTFYTLKPGTYPSRSEAAHIHPVILEPNGKYYYLNSYFFDDDPLLGKEQRRATAERARGGSPGVVTLKREGDLLVAERDFTLGRNIPGYE